VNIYRNRKFVILMSSKLISLYGSAIYEMALVWFILSEYGEASGTLLAWVVSLGFMPTVLFAGFAGAVVDKYNKKTILICSDLVSGILVGTLILVPGFGGEVYLLFVTAVLSLCASLASLTVTGMIQENVLYGECYSTEVLYIANSSNQFVERTTLLLGFATGGLLVAILGVPMVFLLNALSFLGSAVINLMLEYSPSNTPEVSKLQGGLTGQLKKAWLYLRENRELFRLVILGAIINMLWDPLILIVIPYVVKNVFSVSVTEFGLIQAALPMGFCLGTIYLQYDSRWCKKPQIIRISIWTLNSMLILFIIPMMLRGAFEKTEALAWYFEGVLGTCGIISAAINVTTSVVIQTLVPGYTLGKIQGIIKSFSAGLMPLGCAIFGLLIGNVEEYVLFLVPLACIYLLVPFVPKFRLKVFQVTE